MKSIRSKIIFIALLGIFSSAAIIGGYGVFFSDRIIKKSSSRILDLLAESQTVGLNGIFENVEQSVNLLSFYAEESLPSIKNLEKEEDCLDYLERLDALAFFIANCTKNCMAIYVRYDEEVTKRPIALLWRTINGKFIHDNPAPDDGYTENERREAEWFYQPKNKEQNHTRQQKIRSEPHGPHCPAVLQRRRKTLYPGSPGTEAGRYRCLRTGC